MRPIKSFLIASALFFFGIFSPLLASININVDAVQKSVVFLYAADPNGAVDKTRPIGTGFLVFIPLKSDPKHGYRVLVTARHMLDPTWAKCGIENPSVIYARVNKKSEKFGVEFVRIQLVDQGKPTWVHHADNEVDAAVAHITIDEAIFDVESVPVELFPTEAETALQTIGDPVMSAGLLPLLPGNSRNYPIFKFGQISNIPAESIETRCRNDMPTFPVKVWLIAANLVPGNSGSPIFHVPLGGSGISFGGTRPMLIGVQSLSYIGSDVAGMTPIKFVYQILEQQGIKDADLHRGPQPVPSNPEPK